MATGKINTSPGSVMRTDEWGGLIVQQYHGQFREQVNRDHCFFVNTINIAGQAVSVGAATTYTGLYLYNPVGSGVNVSILAITTALHVAEVAISELHLGRTSGAITETSQLTPLSCNIGSTTGSNIRAGYAATIVAPIIVWPLVGGVLATAFPYKSGTDILNALFQFKPGQIAIIEATTAVTGFFGFAWEEIPV